jgi:CheY-like chemotaxis protein
VVNRRPVERRETVLVVEDDLRVLELEIEALASAGYEVTGASTVTEALEVVRVSRPDLVVLDLRLGAEDGLDVARRLREDPVLHDIVVVASSASSSPEDIERAKGAGCGSFLAKPLTARAFIEGVARGLQAAGRPAPAAGTQRAGSTSSEDTP